MSSRYSTSAVILKTEAKGEYDLWCVCFTERFGKMRLLVKGVRKPASKLRAALQPLSFSHIEFVQGKIWRVVDAMLQNRYEGLRSNAKNLRSALAIASLCRRFTEEQDEVLWKNLLEALDILNAVGSDPARRGLTPLSSSLVYYHFLWNLLSRCGYAPAPAPLVTSMFTEPLWRIKTLILDSKERRELSQISRTYLERAITLTS